jgi:hypothetical protein
MSEFGLIDRFEEARRKLVNTGQEHVLEHLTPENPIVDQVRDN